MYLSKLKTFLIFYGIFFILMFVMSIIKGSKIPFEEFIILSLCPVILPYIIGLHKPLIKYFDEKYWENEDEKNFQKNLNRDVEIKTRLSQIDNQNFAFQNQLLNDLEIKRILLNAQIETEKMILQNNLNKEFLTYEKYAEIFFQLVSREAGLNNLDNQTISNYVKQAYDQMGLKIGYSPYGDKE